MGYYIDNELYHHGIKGQRWGIRRFQNTDGTRTAAGKARAKENSSEDAQNEQKKGLSDSQKKALKVGASLVAAGLVAYGGYKLASSPVVKSKIPNVPEIVKKTDFGGNSEIKIGKSIGEIDRKVVSSINKDGWENGQLKPDYARNCSHTSIAYILNTVLGKNVSAKGYSGVDELSGLVTGNAGRSKAIFDAVFDGLEKTEIPFDDLRPDKAAKHIKSSSTGILRLQNNGQGHFVNYEKDHLGNLTLIDSQNDTIIQFKDAFMKNAPYVITDIIDCSNATLKENASQVLEHIVK